MATRQGQVCKRSTPVRHVPQTLHTTPSAAYVAKEPTLPIKGISKLRLITEVDQPVTKKGALVVRTAAPPFRERIQQEKLKVLREAKQKGTSVLGTVAVVSDSSQIDYARRLQAFEAWASAESLTVVYEDDQLLEEVLLEYMDHMCINLELKVSAGTKMIAALGWKVPRFRRLQKTGLLPGVSAALQGWNKTLPESSRDPLPEEAVAGIAAELVRFGLWLMGILTYLATDTYLRPSIILALTADMVILSPNGVVCLLINPFFRGVAAKTGAFDLSTVLDTPGREWLGKILVGLKARTTRFGVLFPFTLKEWRNASQAAALRLGFRLSSVYVFRHSGASADFLKKRRDLMTIKHRGHWRSDNSLRRYEQTARSQVFWNTCSAPLTKFLLTIFNNMQGVLLGLYHVPIFQNAALVLRTSKR